MISPYFSALQRAEIAETSETRCPTDSTRISVLFNEPKLLKIRAAAAAPATPPDFSALQRAEIAESGRAVDRGHHQPGISVLFNEPKLLKLEWRMNLSTLIDFSALQRAEIAERSGRRANAAKSLISVLFNEPKLLKIGAFSASSSAAQISVLFNEPKLLKEGRRG